MDRSISSGPEAERSSGTAARFRIQAMDCAAEESEIRRALEPVAGIVSLSFQLGARTLAISAPQPVIAEALAAIRRAGFDPQPLAPSAQDGNRTADPHDIEGMLDGLRRPVIALLLAAGAEGLAYFGGADLAVTGIEMALAAAAIWLAGFETYRKGFSALRHGRLNITALMSVAVTGAFLIGQWPEAAMVMALYAIAELIEARSLDRARNAIQSLLALAPQQAQLRQADGTWQTVPAADVPVDAIVRIRPGERVPLDGVVTAGAGAIDQAPVTGESIPVDKTIGDGVFAGTINQAAELEIRTTAAADDSTLARIIHAVEQAQGSRAPTQRFVDRFAAVYTPGVFALAVAVTLLSPWLMDWTWAQAAYKALVLLVIACPCALVISTPVTVVSALASAARRGILIKGGVYLEDARKLKAIAFDKTGTITEGKPRLVESVAIDGGDGAAHLALAASLAGRSDHPVSRAIAEGLRLGGVAVGDFQALPGRGVQGTVDGAAFLLGNHRLIEDRGLCSPALEARLAVHENQGRTVTLLASQSAVLALFAVADTIKDSSRAAVAELKALGVTPVLLSGDNAATARTIAQHAGIQDARGDLLPQDKMDAIDALRQRYGATAMTGDGINDAPALARADIGIAMGAAGTDTALEAADVVIMNDDLRRIPELIRLSRRTHSVLWQNISLALGIKAVFLWLAIFGNATMWMAVFADMGASLLVVANGLRLLRARG
ncbi:heavy metal translocating P-type ATPase [Immundisolibacter sp.]|uniref:heavy metal translocating P-type ATPase n=1 Tax=Immundisolibacter sp. TaxID=1934948 RepID=UPI0019CE6AB6|nr:heavy metal translocating P-type ATPase [Immundisolibacter sp.]MBC7161133.1 heavy metal translocating P-type ATPase [Immundisolibacter sp.]MEA3219337.1 Cadmium-transporting ATPase [Immundisolibacter sp.]